MRSVFNFQPGVLVELNYADLQYTRAAYDPDNRDSLPLCYDCSFPYACQSDNDQNLHFVVLETVVENAGYVSLVMQVTGPEWSPY